MARHSGAAPAPSHSDWYKDRRNWKDRRTGTAAVPADRADKDERKAERRTGKERVFTLGGAQPGAPPPIAEMIAQIAGELFTADRVEHAAPQTAEFVAAIGDELKGRQVGPKLGQVLTLGIRQIRRGGVRSPGLTTAARQLIAILRSSPSVILDDAKPSLRNWRARP
jgi:hypothetical protein